MKRSAIIAAAAVCLLSMLFFTLTGCSDAAETEPTAVTMPEDAAAIGNSGYSCVTGISEAVDAIGSDGTRRVQVFAHRIYDPQSEYVVTLTTTVVGIHSREEDTASVIEITGQLSEAAAEGFTISEHISRNTGTVVLYWNDQSVCHFQYRLYPDGTITLL